MDCAPGPPTTVSPLIAIETLKWSSAAPSCITSRWLKRCSAGFVPNCGRAFIGSSDFKIVSRAATQEDNLKILRLIPYALRNGQEIISFCVGEKGRVSRVMSLFLGAYLGFASLSKGEESASGQLSLAEMITVLSTLNEASGKIPGTFRGQAGKELRDV